MSQNTQGGGDSVAGTGQTAPPDSGVKGLATSLSQQPYASKAGVLAATAEDFDRLRRDVINHIESRITYNIDVNYTGKADDVLITYDIPANAFFLSATGNPTTTKKRTMYGVDAPAQLVWSVKAQGGSTGNSI